MKLPLTTLLMVNVLASMAQNNLTVTVQNIKNNNGDILIGLYDQADGFPRHALDGKVVKATGRPLTVTFSNIKPGQYAVSVLHDENQNKDLDQNKIGIPKEGYGFSNNARGIIGPPSFKKAHIVMLPEDKNKDITIKMKYLN